MDEARDDLPPRRGRCLDALAPCEAAVSGACRNGAKQRDGRAFGLFKADTEAVQGQAAVGDLTNGVAARSFALTLSRATADG